MSAPTPPGISQGRVSGAEEASASARRGAWTALAGLSPGGEAARGTVPGAGIPLLSGERNGSEHVVSGSTGGSDEGQDIRGYVSAVRARIETAKLYPRWARRQGLSGKVTIAFRLGRSGDLSQARTLSSSGASVLDEAALEAVRRAAPFPRFQGEPSQLPEEFTVVIEFELR